MAERIVKACPRCGQLLTIKRNRETQEEFFGCTAWPECLFTEPLPEAIRLRRAGQPGLFDDEDDHEQPQ